jgi:hypothetical protein
MNTEQIQNRPIGVIFLAVALVINRFLSGSPFLDFMAGLLTGLSLVLNIKYIVAIANQRKLKEQQTK